MFSSLAPGFKDDHLKRFGEFPFFAAIDSAEAVMIIAEALKKDADPGHLKDTIVGIGRSTVLQGTIALDRFGDPARTFMPVLVLDDRFVPQE